MRQMALYIRRIMFMTLLILAAGLGSRYGGLKQLDPINDYGEFIIDYSVFDAKRAGFDRVVFVIKEENYDAFRETIGSRIEGHIKVDYCFQKMDNIPAWASIPEGRTKPTMQYSGLSALSFASTRCAATFLNVSKP